ncbi:hypothetical protein [Streptomyces sp. NPDC020996]|uniref:hypothetical protein n=1 Tax=Streptomyces sp. NPDC020996 TaxID=3154791 RepID=UPI0033E04415
MRVRRVPVLAVAVIGAALLTGCQPNDIEADPSLTAGASPAASKPSDNRPPATDAPPSQDGTPSSARRVVDAPQAGGLPKATGRAQLTDVPVDPGDVRDNMNMVEQKYLRKDSQGRQANVLVVAVDNVPEETSKRREYLFRGMLDYLKWEGTPPQAQPIGDVGPLGGSVECLLASFVEDGDVVCGWADDTTAGVVHFPNSTVPEAEKLIVAMRADLEK